MKNKYSAASLCYYSGRNWISPFWTCPISSEEFRHGVCVQRLSQKSGHGECYTYEHAGSCERMAEVCCSIFTICVCFIPIEPFECNLNKTGLW